MSSKENKKYLKELTPTLYSLSLFNWEKEAIDFLKKKKKIVANKFSLNKNKSVWDLANLIVFLFFFKRYDEVYEIGNAVKSINDEDVFKTSAYRQIRVFYVLALYQEENKNQSLIGDLKEGIHISSNMKKGEVLERSLGKYDSGIEESVSKKVKLELHIEVLRSALVLYYKGYEKSPYSKEELESYVKTHVQLARDLLSIK